MNDEVEPGRRRSLKDLLNESIPSARIDRKTKNKPLISESSTTSSMQSVFVPIRPVVQEGRIVAAYEFRQRAHQPPYLPVFSTHERLIAELGEIQTRLEINLARIMELVAPQYIEIDPEVDPTDWRWTGEQAATYAELLNKEIGHHD